MTVDDLHKALSKMVEDGHGEADVAHVNGTGKSTVVCGWELVTSAGYDHRSSVSLADQKRGRQLKLHTNARF